VKTCKRLSISVRFRDTCLTSGFLSARSLARNMLRSDFVFTPLSDVVMP
jgi:hypothetical protein